MNRYSRTQHPGTLYSRKEASVDKNEIALVRVLGLIGVGIQDMGSVLDNPQKFKDILYELSPVSTGRLLGALLRTRRIYHFMILLEYSGLDRKKLYENLFRIHQSFEVVNDVVSKSVKYNSDKFKETVKDILENISFHSDFVTEEVIRDSLEIIND